MTTLTDLDRLILGRWQDTMGLQESLEELQDKLGRLLEEVGRELEPWAIEQGYRLCDVDKKHAEVLFTKEGWLNAENLPRVSLAVGGVFPYGYRRVKSEHPYLWIYASDLADDAIQQFRDDLQALLGPRAADWAHKHCDDDGPFGRYIETHTDPERAQMAGDPGSLRAFIKFQASELMAIGALVDRAVARLSR